MLVLQVLQSPLSNGKMLHIHPVGSGSQVFLIHCLLSAPTAANWEIYYHLAAYSSAPLLGCGSCNVLAFTWF